MREPYYAYMQGGLTYESARLAIMAAADKMRENYTARNFSYIAI